MIFVRMGLSLAWQNGSQNGSFLTTLRCNRQPMAPDPPQSHFMQPVRVNITTSVDESQSEGIILVRSQSNYKNDSLTGESVYDPWFMLTTDSQSFVNHFGIYYCPEKYNCLAELPRSLIFILSITSGKFKVTLITSKFGRVDLKTNNCGHGA